jgi:hypothetical protein
MARVESEHIRHLLKTARSKVTLRRTKSKYSFSLSIRPLGEIALFGKFGGADFGRIVGVEEEVQFVPQE